MNEYRVTLRLFADFYVFLQTKTHFLNNKYKLEIHFFFKCLYSRSLDG